MSKGGIKTAIVGVGRWGKHVARELAAASELVGYVSRSAEGNPWMAEHHPNTRAMMLEEVCAEPEIQAVAVATPIATHVDIARQLLRSGKHVLVEKPLAQNAAEARELAALATAQGVILVTGYVFLYHPVYQELKRRISSPISHLTLEWKKYGSFTEPIDLNLLTHHLSIANDLLGKPHSGALRELGTKESPCDKIETKLFYPQAEVVSLIDRMSDQKSHIITAACADGSAYVWDNTALYTLGTDGTRTRVYESSEQPLALEIGAFLTAAESGSALPSGGAVGAEVLEIHEILEISTK